MRSLHHSVTFCSDLDSQRVRIVILIWIDFFFSFTSPPLVLTCRHIYLSRKIKASGCELSKTTRLNWNGPLCKTSKTLVQITDDNFSQWNCPKEKREAKCRRIILFGVFFFVCFFYEEKIYKCWHGKRRDLSDLVVKLKKKTKKQKTKKTCWEMCAPERRWKMKRQFFF